MRLLPSKNLTRSRTNSILREGNQLEVRSQGSIFSLKFEIFYANSFFPSSKRDLGTCASVTRISSMFF